MKRHLVFDSNHSFKGVLYDKLDLHLFKRQRPQSDYHVYSMHEDEIEEKFGDLHLSEYEGVNFYGVIMFPYEEQMFYESFDQMQMDFRAIISSFLREAKPIVRFKDDEIEKVETFLSHIYGTLQEIEFLCHDEEEVFEYDKFYNIPKLVTPIIGQINEDK